MSKAKRCETIDVNAMAPAQVRTLLKELPEYMPKPEFRLFREGPDADGDAYWVQVEARDARNAPSGWGRYFAGHSWDGVDYYTPEEEPAATRKALQNCLDALYIHRVSFCLDVRDADGQDAEKTDE